jgi:hypothetical protein
MRRRDIELPDLCRLVVMPKQCIVQAMKAISVHSIALRGSTGKGAIRNVTSRSIYGDAMGLKIRLRWFDKISELLIEKEYSQDFRNDSKILGELNIPLENNINNGNLDVVAEWVEILQPHFAHPLDLSKYDYQISFDYRDVW